MDSRAPAATAAAEDDGTLASPTKTVTRVLRSHAKPPPEHQIATPQKTPEPPRFARGPGVVYSLRQVKRAVIGLHRAGEDAPDVGKNRDAEDGAAAATSEEEQDSSGPRLVDLGKKRAKAAASALAKIPEKYEMLAQFFNSLETSYRLLRLKRQMCTFSNIAPKIEYLTDKRFTYRHLAQLKHLVPEAISVKKMLSVDEVTSCMKPDLQITLHSDAFGDSFEGKRLSGYSVLTKMFRSRLLDFCREHAEDDIPEDELPEPFTCKKSASTHDVVEESDPASGPSLPVAADERESEKQHAASSHLSKSFQRRFSQKGRLTGKILSADELVTSEIIETTNSTLLSPKKCIRKLPACSKATPANMLPLVKPTISCDGTPKKSTESFPLNSMDQTPARTLSTPARLMCPTPDLRTPKRSWSEVDDNPRPSKKPVKRPLTMTPEKSTVAENDTSEADSDLDDAALHFLPKALLQSVREREKKAMEDQQAGVSERRIRQQMVARLPKLFDMILLVFQSIRRSVITKEELVNKLIAGHCDIADRSEVEEQLTLLQELLPDWITGKMASSGDYIFCIDKISSPEMLRRRLAEAK